MINTKKQIEKKERNSKMLDTLKMKLFNKIITIKDYPVDLLVTHEYIDKLEQLYLGEVVEEMIEEKGVEEPTFESLEEMQSGVIDRFVKEIIKIQKEETSIIDLILISELLNSSFTDSLDYTLTMVGETMRELRDNDWIDRNLDLDIREVEEALTIEIKYCNKEIIVPTQVEDSFTMAYNLISINSDNVIYVEDAKEGSYENTIISKGRNEYEF